MKYCIAIGSKTSMFTPLLLGGNVEANLIKAGEIGFDGVELNVLDLSTVDVKRLNRICRERNLSITTLATGAIYGTYGLSLTDFDRRDCDKLIEMVRVYLDLAARLGSHVTIGSIKGNIRRDEDRPEGLKILGENLKRISEYAGQTGVTVLLEATNRLENNVLNTAKEICDMIEEYELEHFKILMDSFHVNIEETDISGCLRDAGKHLGYIHFGDNNRWYPGAGCFRFDLFNQAIKDIGYDGVLSAECFPRPDGETAARKTYEFFKRNFG